MAGEVREGSGLREKTSKHVMAWSEVPWGEKMVFERDLPPVSPKTKMITVVPTYNEYSNGNVWRLLEDALNQGNPDLFEVLLIVNNRPEEENSDQYQDNQKLLYVFQALQAVVTEAREKRLSNGQAQQALFEILKKESLFISKRQKNLLKNAIKKKLRFYAVDASSKGNTLLGEHEGYNIRGVARHVGGKIAHRRLLETKSGEDGLIDFIDGDYGMSDSYVKRILETGRRNRKMPLFVKDMLVYAPSIPEWARVSPLKRVSLLMLYLRRNITIRRGRYLRAEKADVHEGPTPIVRAGLFRQVNGYPRKIRDEDFLFGRILRNEIENMGLKTIRVDGMHVRLSDRGSETSVDGLTWLSHKKLVSSEWVKNPGAFKRYFDPSILSNLEDGSYKEYVDSVLQQDRYQNSNVRYREARARYWNEEVEKSKKRVKSLRKTIKALVALKRAKPVWATFSNPENLRRWLNRKLTGRVSAKEIDYLVGNPTIVASVMTVRKILRSKKQREELGIPKSGNDFKKVWAFFEKYLPEYFLVLENNEPNYDEMLLEFNQTGNLPKGYNLRMLSHLVQANREYNNPTRN